MQNRHFQTKNDLQTDFQGETISQLARRHLLNPSHTTTDEELRNARIEFNDNFDTSVTQLSKISE